MIEPRCILSGDNFNPSHLIDKLTDVTIEKIIGTGEISNRGRYKLQPSPYGLCQIWTPSNVPMPDRIKWMTTLISQHSESFRSSGVTDIELNILWTGRQGNMEFTHEELVGIAELGIPLTINYSFEEKGN